MGLGVGVGVVMGGPTKTIEGIRQFNSNYF